MCLLFRWTLAILTLPSPSEKESTSISNERLGESSNRLTIYVPLDSGVKIVFPEKLKIYHKKRVVKKNKFSPHWKF